MERRGYECQAGPVAESCLLWHQFRSQAIGRAQLIEKSIRLEKKLFALAERHMDNPEGEVLNMARALFEKLRAPVYVHLPGRGRTH